MKRTVRQDPFFLDQPPLAFLDELRSPMHHRPDSYNTRSMEPGEINVNGLYLAETFPEGEALLKTVYDDFAAFTKEYAIAGEAFPVYLKKSETACFEAYTVDIRSDCVIISAADTEGIRRGIIRLEDELKRSEAPFLTP